MCVCIISLLPLAAMTVISSWSLMLCDSPLLTFYPRDLVMLAKLFKKDLNGPTDQLSVDVD